MVLRIHYFVVQYKLYAMVMDASHGLHNLCGFSHDDPILEKKFLLKYVYQAPFAGQKSDRVINIGGSLWLGVLK
jgi:hypothetical protein